MAQDVSAAEPTTAGKVPRNVVVLGLVSFFADVSSEMVCRLIPLFLTRLLGAPVVTVGLIEGVDEGTASILRLLSGWWSDRVGRRLPLVVLGYGLAKLGKLMLALAGAWPIVFAARFVDRFCRGVRGSPSRPLPACAGRPRPAKR
jgi:MFS family permease